MGLDGFSLAVGFGVFLVFAILWKIVMGGVKLAFKLAIVVALAALAAGVYFGWIRPQGF